MSDRQYLTNLTDHLISKNGFDRLTLRREEFIKHVAFELSIREVYMMSPGKLGEIMCAFEIGDVMASKQMFFDHLSFGGDCGEMLRKMVSVCLAYYIDERIHYPEATSLVPYQRQQRAS